MTKRHVTILIPASFLAILAGVLKPTISIFLGRIFDDLAAFGSGTTAGGQLLTDVSRWCIALTALGLAAWLVNGGFFALWLVFGELQVKSVREKMFKGMLEKEMAWYDLRSDGIASLLNRIQT